MLRSITSCASAFAAPLFPQPAIDLFTSSAEPDALLTDTDGQCHPTTPNVLPDLFPDVRIFSAGNPYALSDSPDCTGGRMLTSLALPLLGIGAILVFGDHLNPAGETFHHLSTGASVFFPAFSRFFEGLFEDKEPSDKKIARLSEKISGKLTGQARERHLHFGDGERMERGRLIRYMLTAGIADGDIVDTLSDAFQKAGSGGGPVFSPLGQLVGALTSAKMENADVLKITARVAAMDADDVPFVCDIASLLILKGGTPAEIWPLLDLAKEYCKGRKTARENLRRLIRELGPKLAVHILSSFNNELLGALEICQSLKVFGFSDDDMIRYLEFAHETGFRPIRLLLGHLEGVNFRRSAMTVDEFITSYTVSLSVPALGVYRITTPKTREESVLLDEMRQIAGCVARAVDRDSVYREAVPVFERTYHRVEEIFRDIDSGILARPPDAVLKKYAKAWAIATDNLFKYHFSRNPAQGRKMFWDMISMSFSVLSAEVQDVFKIYGPELEDLIARYLRARRDRLSGKFDFFADQKFQECASKLIKMGVIANPRDRIRTLPDDERWPDGGSGYVRDVLRPYYDEQLEDLVIPHDIEREFAQIFAQYLRFRAEYPPIPSEVLFGLAASFGGRFLRLIELEVLSMMHRKIGRYMAALPDETFARYETQITRDFPDALHYRNGQRQAIDTAAIENALRHPPGGENLIMHIGVHNDIQFVRESLKNVSPQGEVVIVDNKESAFEAFHEDPETKDAIASGKLIIEHTDAFGDELKKKYRSRVDRMYLLHPSGKIGSVLEEIMAQGGIFIFQSDDETPEMSKYRIERDMHMSGAFDKLAGYANGHAWFKTETARRYNYIGIRFLVSRRR